MKTSTKRLIIGTGLVGLLFTAEHGSAAETMSAYSFLPRCESGSTADGIKAMAFPLHVKVLALKEAHETGYDPGVEDPYTIDDKEKRSCAATALTTIGVLRATYTIQWFEYVGGHSYIEIKLFEP